ncbi:Hypothetical protein D9617_22g066850 [Elsinoe fawcettii]|nr:Hypothetical protein D9617_22g066850 [Elsinoe fawcettii]
MAALPRDSPAPPPSKSNSVADVADNIFMRRVLRLTGPDKESTYDYNLTQEATELGLTVTPPPVPAPLTPLPHHRRPSVARDGRSISTDSFASKSSRPTSDLAKSWDRTSTGFNSLQSYNRRGSATSSSSRSRDSVLSQPIPIVKKSRNSSVPPTTPRLGRQSPESPQPSSPHRHLIRGLTRLRLRRHDSDKTVQACRHCSGTSSPGDLHRLSCGHTLCTNALRDLIDLNQVENSRTWPTCCGQKIPKNLVDLVRQNRKSFAPSNPVWTDAMRRQMSDQGSRASTTPEPIETVRESIESDDLEAVDRSTVASINLAKALRIPEYALLRTKHTQQRNRLLRWDTRHRADLQASAEQRRIAVTQEFDRLQDELLDKHASTLVTVEDMHVSAEADLRESQETERRNTHTALRHMEAYCRGESANGEPHGRTISDQDRLELVKAQRLRDNMDIRHESAINVLRGEQNHRMRQRLKRHDQEIDQLNRRRERELDRIKRDFISETREWSAEMQRKKATLERWWIIETQICLKKHGESMGLSFDDLLTPLAWSREPGLETTFDNFADELESWDDEGDEDDDAGKDETPTPESLTQSSEATEDTPATEDVDQSNHSHNKNTQVAYQTIHPVAYQNTIRRPGMEKLAGILGGMHVFTAGGGHATSSPEAHTPPGVVGPRVQEIESDEEDDGDLPTHGGNSGGKPYIPKGSKKAHVDPRAAFDRHERPRLPPADGIWRPMNTAFWMQPPPSKPYSQGGPPYRPVHRVFENMYETGLEIDTAFLSSHGQGIKTRFAMLLHFPLDDPKWDGSDDLKDPAIDGTFMTDVTWGMLSPYKALAIAATSPSADGVKTGGGSDDDIKHSKKGQRAGRSEQIKKSAKKQRNKEAQKENLNKDKPQSKVDNKTGPPAKSKSKPPTTGTIRMEDLAHPADPNDEDYPPNDGRWRLAAGFWENAPEQKSYREGGSPFRMISRRIDGYYQSAHIVDPLYLAETGMTADEAFKEPTEQLAAILGVDPDTASKEGINMSKVVEVFEAGNKSEAGSVSDGSVSEGSRAAAMMKVFGERLGKVAPGLRDRWLQHMTEMQKQGRRPMKGYEYMEKATVEAMGGKIDRHGHIRKKGIRETGRTFRGCGVESTSGPRDDTTTGGTISSALDDAIDSASTTHLGARSLGRNARRRRARENRAAQTNSEMSA